MGEWSRIELVRGDIVDQDVDAIVNAANTSLLGGGGVDGASAARNGVTSIAVPSISTGAFRYPVTDAAPIALATVEGMLAGEAGSVGTVRFVLWDSETHSAYRKALRGLQIPGRQG